MGTYGREKFETLLSLQFFNQNYLNVPCDSAKVTYADVEN